METWQLLVIADTFFGFLGMAVWYRVGKIQGQKLKRQTLNVA